MNKNIKNVLFGTLTFIILVPIVSFAALNGLKGLLQDVKEVFKLLEPILFGLAFIYFFWGMGQFILHSGEEKAREEGRNKMIWGIIALFVMLSVMGVIYFFGNLIGITPDNSSGGSATNNNSNSNSSLPTDVGCIDGSPYDFIPNC